MLRFFLKKKKRYFRRVSYQVQISQEIQFLQLVLEGPNPFTAFGKPLCID